MKIFGNNSKEEQYIEFDILKYNEEREKKGLPKIEITPITSEEIENLNNFCKSINHEGCLLSDSGENKKAIERYNLVLSVNPKYLDALYNKGRALHLLGEYSKAIESYDEVLIIDPKHILTLHNKGMDLFCMERYNEAIEVFDSVLKIDTTHTNAIHNKKVTLEKLNKQ